MAARAAVWAAATLALLAPAADAKTKAKIGDYFSLCKRSDPDLSGCIKRSIEEAKPRFLPGIPALRLPPVDPLFIPAMELREGQGGFEFLFAMTNMTVTGLRDFTIASNEVDLTTGRTRMDLRTPRITFRAFYKMRGRILALPINGDGESTLDFTGVRTVANIVLKNVTRKGKTYGKVESFKWDISILENAKSEFTNLFNGDKQLGDTMNRFLNENWREAFETYKHLPEEAFAVFFTNLYDQFFEQFSLDELYPE